MSDNPFDSAGGGAYIINDDHLGALLLISPKEHLQEVETDFGSKDALLADAVVLDRDGVNHREIVNTMILAKQLIGSLKYNIGKKPVLGVLAKGEAKKGQKPPWILQPVPAGTPDHKIALDYWNNRKIENPFA